MRALDFPFKQANCISYECSMENQRFKPQLRLAHTCYSFAIRTTSGILNVLSRNTRYRIPVWYSAAQYSIHISTVPLGSVRTTAHYYRTPCCFCCSPNPIVHMSIDSVTTICTSDNCTQREPKPLQLLITYTQKIERDTFLHHVHMSNKWKCIETQARKNGVLSIRVTWMSYCLTGWVPWTENRETNGNAWKIQIYFVANGQNSKKKSQSVLFSWLLIT